jgi:hypothetical protein
MEGSQHGSTKYYLESKDNDDEGSTASIRSKPTLLLSPASGANDPTCGTRTKTAVSKVDEAMIVKLMGHGTWG